MELIKTICKILYYIVDLVILSYFLYYVITGLFAFRKKKNKIRKYKEKSKFAIVVAARNESKVIGNLLDSLNKQNYSKDLYDIFVVPNNCTDNTEEVSIQKGAKIIDCKCNVKAKGDALKYAFKYLLTSYPEYDAFCVFDADNIVHPDYLRRMNDTLCSGYRVAQGYRDSKNPSDTWISCCYSLFYWVQNYFFNQARMNMGWSASINGTGFMLSSEFIKEFGFNTKTLTEDIEFAAQCALNDEKIAFVKDAITYDEQPLGFSQSWKQRKRWSIGTMQCLRIYSPKLLKAAIKKKIPQAFDMSLFFLAPIIQILTAAIIVLLIIYNFFGIHVSDYMKFIYDNKMLSVLLGYIVSILISFLVLLADKKKIKPALKGIFTFYIFMLTWIPINIMCCIKKDFVWEPIEHSRTVDIDSIVKVENK